MPPADDKSRETFVVADLFCGAGGTSTGAQKAIERMGARLDLAAVNHWPVAVETHQLNHPTARHYIEDLSGADPESIIPAGWLDLLMASPECRYYSRARGGKPIHDQGRMNPWIVQRWLTALDVRCLLIENVPEFTGWGPLGQDGRPDKSRKGLYFSEWVNSIAGLGYDVEWRMLNAADFGEATTRIRFFLQARKDGQPIRWPEPTHTRRVPGEDRAEDDLPRWRGAREIIDWSNPGRSLLDDPKYARTPLSVNTRRRIARGLRRFGGPLAPFYVRLLDLPEDAMPCDEAQTDEIALASPFHGSDRNNTLPRHMDEPIPTVTTWASGGCYMVRPSAQPFILGQQSGGAPRHTDQPIPTVSTDGAISFIRPIITEYYGNGSSRSVDDPVSAITTKARHGFTQPTIVPIDDTGSPPNGTNGHAPQPNESAYVVPNFGERKGQKPRVHSLSQPVPAVTSRGAGSLVSPVMTLAPADLAGVDPRRIVLLDGRPHLLDIRYRMLQNPELARAMGFSDEESEYEFVGNISEITKQIGNAVPVRLAAALVGAILAPDAA